MSGQDKNPNSSLNNTSTDNSTSEVGSASTPDQWNILLQFMQNPMRQLSTDSRNFSLPRFNPENAVADPIAWCTAADMC